MIQPISRTKNVSFKANAEPLTAPLTTCVYAGGFLLLLVVDIIKKARP